jgi:hypothetical protein
MKRKIVAVLAIQAMVAFAVAPILFAASVSISFTAGQNTYVQTTIIPQANLLRCLQYGIISPPLCTTANVIAAGCVPAPFSAVNKKNLVYRDCTIYTQDAAGEAAHDADRLYTAMVTQVSQDLDFDVTQSCQAFKSATLAVQQSNCTAVGRPIDCNFCR